MLDLEMEKQNRKIIDLLAGLDTLSGKITESPIDLSAGQSLFLDELYGSELNEESKRTRSKYLILKDFLWTKKLEGCSNLTIKSYYDCIFPFIITTDKSISEITTVDIRSYLNQYHETHEINNRSMDNMRRIFSSFFAWLQSEDYVIKNPMSKIKRIKAPSTVKKPFSDEDIEKLRDSCVSMRDLVIVEILVSSGMRVSELCMLDILDVNANTREAVVQGKGDKERLIYFDARTKLHLQKYLAQRIDDNPALIVSQKYPYRRMQRSGIEVLLKELGDKAGVENVYPHRFRRTFATNMIDRGVPIEQVQRMLGHTKIDTTLIYASVNQNNVRSSHRKFI